MHACTATHTFPYGILRYVQSPYHEDFAYALTFGWYGGVDILAGNLVWIQGPYPAGKYTNIKIMNKVLRNFLEPGKWVEADEGYPITAATPTKSYVRGTMRIRRRIGECRGG